MTANPYIYAGAALVGLVLIDQAQGRYLTAAQKAALKVLNAAGPDTRSTVDAMCSHVERTAYADDVSADVICEQVLAAAHAGAFVTDPNAAGGEAYNPYTDARWFAGESGGFAGDIYQGTLEAQWLAFGDADSDAPLSDFGRALGRLEAARLAMNANPTTTTVNAATAACQALASAMDAQGLRSSAPKDVTPLSWAFDHTIGALLPSTETVVIAVVAIAGVAFLAARYAR